MKHPRTAVSLAALLATAAIGLVGCSAAPEAEPSSPAAPDQLIDIKFVQAPQTDFAPVWVAISEGFFEEEGLNVMAENAGVQSAAESASLLVSGEFQLAVSALPNLAAAAAQGVDLVIVSGLTTFGGADDHAIEIIGKADGPSSLTELATAGTVIGINGGELGPNHVMTMNAIDAAGGDSSVPTYQSVPYAQAAELVLNNSIVAGNVMEPFRGTALQNPELKVIGSVSGALQEGTPSLSLVTSTAYAADNPEVLASIRAAISKAIEWIEDPANEEAYLDLVSENSGQDRAVLAEIPKPSFAGQFSEAAAKKLLEINVHYGALQTMPELNGLVVSEVMN